MENDENCPKGSYQSSCGGCSYDEKTHILTCKKCPNTKNEMVESTLEVTEGCEIISRNGVLMCDEIPDIMADANAKKPADKKEL